MPSIAPAFESTVPEPPDPTLRGTEHPNAKLDEATVRAIWAHRARRWSFRQIARKFAISAGHAQRICAGTAWSHVEKPKPAAEE